MQYSLPTLETESTSLCPYVIHGSLLPANVSSEHWFILFGPEVTEMVTETAGSVLYNYARGTEVGGGVCDWSTARRVVEMRCSFQPLLVGKRLIGHVILS